MDLVSALAPPRCCRLGGVDLWVRPYGLEDYALLLAWLDDVLPGKADRKVPPRLGSPEAGAAMESATGRLLIAWAALRHQGYTRDAVVSLLASTTDLEWISFLAAIFAGRRTAKDAGGDGRDIADQWFGPNFAVLAERYGHTLETIGRLSLDQYALLCGEGLEDEDPKILTAEQVEAMRQEGLRRMAEREAREAAARLGPVVFTVHPAAETGPHRDLVGESLVIGVPTWSVTARAEAS